MSLNTAQQDSFSKELMVKSEAGPGGEGDMSPLTCRKSIEEHQWFFFFQRAISKKKDPILGLC